ncbi:alanine racemase [Halomonas halocynthiae]|uniref:alanine racemase n=1 Tax=Halomonas halocynthiae TaxID=176290 RepID=UPI00041C5DCC|nr:alanine racemase [Halomonas halocynthiae]
MARPLFADIDLDALRHNYCLARDLAPRSKTLAVLKANAYGHGLVDCARALEALVPAFAVASIEEADTLRDGGISAPIVLLEGIFDAQELERVDSRGYWVAVHSEWQVEALLAYRPTQPIPAWVKVDTGMHRLGSSLDQVGEVWQRLKAAPAQVSDLHLMSHLATADAADDSYFRRQIALMTTLADTLGAPTSLANSPATLAWPQAHGSWNRPGIMLYGSEPREQVTPPGAGLRPVMTLRSEIIAVRELGEGEPVGYGGRWKASRPSRLGVVACGYGDGYDRHAVDGTPVLVNGQRACIAGKVSMDMLVVDITDLPDAGIGSEVVLWGKAANGELLSVDEVAGYCETISYTLLTGVLPRVPRRYHSA